jgi:myotubularin-related protein 3/4
MLVFLLLYFCMLQAKEDALQRELHTTRQALIRQVCHHCNHTNAERPDDVVSDVTITRLSSRISFMLLLLL